MAELTAMQWQEQSIRGLRCGMAGCSEPPRRLRRCDLPGCFGCCYCPGCLEIHQRGAHGVTAPAPEAPRG